MIIKCAQCDKEFEAKRKTAKYCGDDCRKLAFFKRGGSVLKDAKISVLGNSVPTGAGTGICHGCLRKFMEIKNEWVGEPDENLALKMCICLDCLNKGVTHESLGLNQENCDDNKKQKSI